MNLDQLLDILLLEFNGGVKPHTPPPPPLRIHELFSQLAQVEMLRICPNMTLVVQRDVKPQLSLSILQLARMI